MQDELRSSVSRFLTYLAETIDISEASYDLAEKRYQAVGNWLCRDGSNVKALNPVIYPQGSFRLGTVIKPVTDTEEYDIDLVCELKTYKNKISQKTLKDLVGREIKEYSRANGMKNEPEEGRRCWTLNYAGDAQFHMDILPAIPDGASFGQLLESKGLKNNWAANAIAITDNTHANYDRIDTDWPRSNPKGYAEWFKEQMKVRFEAQRLLLAESYRAKVEDIPGYKVKTPLQRAIQLLKRHRDIMFTDNPDDKPISVIISTLAAQAYSNEIDLLDALFNILNNMQKFIRNDNGIIIIPNPVNPLENFADKWQEYPNRKKEFFRWLQKARTDLDNVLKSENINIFSNNLKPLFGDKMVSRAYNKLVPRQLILPVVAGRSRALARFDVAHRQTPNWPLYLQYYVDIKAIASQQSYKSWQVNSDKDVLPKDCWIEFEAVTNVPSPYKVYWQVVNTGQEAQKNGDLRGSFFEGVNIKRGSVNREHTAYTGMHWIECFIVKNGTCVARSGEFVVNVA